MDSLLPRILDQPLAWFHAHQGQRIFSVVRDWIFGPLHAGDDVDAVLIEDPRGRTANLSRVPGSDVMVAWNMRPNGQIVVLHIGLLGELPW